ncbi:Exostosin-2 [Manis pentadactyla]|nr:Exostosin-2 [Manis pentadactyla]
MGRVGTKRENAAGGREAGDKAGYFAACQLLSDTDEMYYFTQEEEALEEKLPPSGEGERQQLLLSAQSVDCGCHVDLRHGEVTLRKVKRETRMSALTNIDKRCSYRHLKLASSPWPKKFSFSRLLHKSGSLGRIE